MGWCRSGDPNGHISRPHLRRENLAASPCTSHLTGHMFIASGGRKWGGCTVLNIQVMHVTVTTIITTTTRTLMIPGASLFIWARCLYKVLTFISLDKGSFSGCSVVPRILLSELQWRPLHLRHYQSLISVLIIYKRCLAPLCCR
ncbi:hypothetical protein O3P69_005043 [Scylla paramamosain]|uniref:Uncharacterized protein n=1 Tax=Scylla paramamosain TaxID=85552 RepID=A0AAW0U9U9_SCYPA